MAQTVTVKYFGSPQVWLNGDLLTFSFAKINALIYYLVIEQRVSRDEIASLLWPEKDEKNAKKNLRNTIYQANKVVGKDFIYSPNNKIIELNSDYIIEYDAQVFEDDPVNAIDVYEAEFLKGFYLKDSEAFDAWLTEMRLHYGNLFRQACYTIVESGQADADLELHEHYLLRLISIDEFDERNYQLLMRFYAGHQLNGRVIDTYYKLSNILREELGIAPSEETQDLYESIITDVSQSKIKEETQDNIFIGRHEQIEQLEVYLRQADKRSTIILIEGENGVGKSVFARRVMSHNHHLNDRIQIEGQPQMAAHPLLVWKEMIDQIQNIADQKDLILPPPSKPIQDILDEGIEYSIEELNPMALSSLAQYLSALLNFISQESKETLLFIENLDLFSDDNLSVIAKILLQSDVTNIPIICTVRPNELPGLTQFEHLLKRHRRFERIKLKPFSLEEIETYIERNTQIQDPKALAKDILTESSGIPSLVTFYLQYHQGEMSQDEFKEAVDSYMSDQWLAIEPMALDLLELMTYFPQGITFEDMLPLIPVSSSELSRLIDQLVAYRLIEEAGMDQVIVVRFIFDSMRNYLYYRQNVSKRRNQHLMIAEELEKRFDKDPYNKRLINNIMYHYQRAEQSLKAISYELELLSVTLHFRHELFPTIIQENHYPQPFEESSHEVNVERFEDLAQRLNHLDDNQENSSLYRLVLIKYYYLVGRYGIRMGSYRQGLANIHQVIALASELDNHYYLLASYRQMINYAIQVDDPQEMSYYLDLAFDVAFDDNNYEMLGTLLRLRGLWYLMRGDLAQAEDHFKQSLNYFSILNKATMKYIASLAATYDYLAEVYRIRKDYKQAFYYHSVAIDSTKTSNFPKSTEALVHINYGISSFQAGDLDQALIHLQIGENTMRQTVSFWKEAQMKAYLALIFSKQENYDACLKYIQKMDAKKALEVNPRDKGIVYFVKTLVSQKMEVNNISHPLTQYLDKSSQYYLERAKEYLNATRDAYELEVLGTVSKTLD